MQHRDYPPHDFAVPDGKRYAVIDTTTDEDYAQVDDIAEAFRIMDRVNQGYPSPRYTIGLAKHHRDAAAARFGTQRRSIAPTTK